MEVEGKTILNFRLRNGIQGQQSLWRRKKKNCIYLQVHYPIGIDSWNGERNAYRKVYFEDRRGVGTV